MSPHSRWKNKEAEMETIKRFRYWIALIVLVLPIVLRGVWFYHGLPSQSKVLEPDYAANAVPQPPISTPAPEKVQSTSGKIVILDDSHGNQFTPSEVEDFISELTKRGAQIEVDTGDPSLGVRLKYASAYILFSPSTQFTADEIGQLKAFEGRGGRLIVFADPTRFTTTFDSSTGAAIPQPDVDYINPILMPFRIMINKDYLYDLDKNEGNFRNVYFAQFGKNSVTSGLSQVVFYGTHSLMTQDGTPLILGDAHTLSSNTDTGNNLAAAVLSADGNVLAFGDFSFLIPPYNTVADNGLLVNRIADFALSGSRLHTVADFPYVFDRSVSVVPTGTLQIGSDLLDPIASLQKALQATGVTLELKPKPAADNDLLVLGSLSSSDDLTPYLEPFNLGMDDPLTVTLPDFGTINRSGVGLLLYQHTPARNTLVVLTDSSSDLPTLISSLAAGDLSSCVMEGDVGVCSVSSGGSSSFESSPSPTYTLPELATPTPVLSPSTATATPGG